jgi:hypothetical protein
MIWIFLIILSVLSAVLGRMGGADGFDTKFRDAGCSVIAVFGLSLFVPFQIGYWWVYLIIIGLHWLSFSSYWDWLFGFDNLWFSGFMVGMSMLPAVFIVHSIWWIIIIRALVLAIAWGCFNKFLPKKVFCWRHDVGEELLRYAVSL